MKLQLNKKKLKNLSKDNQALPMALTPQVAGGREQLLGTHYEHCLPPTERETILKEQ
ncbi:hypothetical protein SG34_032970 [Thalassomonas viridans]|uniref:Uncharacterized protein n=1 Tax=Thalassomonas viridans TaxID=137584 RepID=A0AAE9Z8Z3_9GAMM|nr:hypothetical protein [Thalassomonas viridans]WDE08718.1 hypothetical protein SG34_032970 [Thalassomonas viridans]